MQYATHLTSPHLLRVVAVIVKWGGSWIHWNGCLFTCGRNYLMEGVNKDKLPTMITLAQDPFQDIDEDLDTAALEAFSFLMTSPGLLLDVYCLMVTPEDIEKAKVRKQSVGDSLAAELDARFQSDLLERQAAYAKEVAGIEKAEVVTAKAEVVTVKAEEVAEPMPKAEEVAAKAGKAACAGVSATGEAVAQAKKELKDLQKQARAEAKAKEKEDKQAAAKVTEEEQKSKAEAQRAAMEDQFALQLLSVENATTEATTTAEAAGAAPETPELPVLASPEPHVPVPEDDDEPVIVEHIVHEQPKIYLDDYGLTRWRAPSDGACMLWAGDVADGSIPPDAFNWGRGTESPLEWEDEHTRAKELSERMRAQRLNIVKWQLDPDNLFTMRNEHELLEPDHSSVLVDEVNQYLDDRAWSMDIHIKARQALAGGDLVVVEVHRDKSGKEYFLDKVRIFRSSSTEVQEITSFLNEVLQRLEAQRMGPVERTVSFVEYAHSNHFNALVSTSVLSAAAPTPISAAAPTPKSYGAESPAGVTHALTIKGAQLTRVILERIKRIENRHFKISAGWYGLHTGQHIGAAPFL